MKMPFPIAEALDKERLSLKGKSTGSVLLAGTLWGLISIFVRALSAIGLGSMEITAVRMMVAAPCFFVWLLIRDSSQLRVRIRDLWMFAGTGIVSIVFFNACYFTTILKSQASVAVVLLYTSPVFIMLLSAVFFQEALTAKKLLALVMTLGGCVLVAGLTGGAYAITLGVLVTGLASGFFYGLYTIFGRVALARYSTMTVTAYTFLFGLAGCLVAVQPAHIVRLIVQDRVAILSALGIGVFCTVFTYFFYNWGLQRMESGRAAILAAIEPVVGAVLGMAVYGESHNLMKILGMLLILGAIFLLNTTGKGVE